MNRIHKEEMIRFANSPDGTLVWCKLPTNTLWCTRDAPIWDKDLVYIIDDEYATLRKQFIDDPTQLQWFDKISKEWETSTLTDLDIFTRQLHVGYIYRIKPKTVTKWRWVMYITTQNDYYVTIDWYTEEEVSKRTDRPIYKIEESARESEE
jgi:hypothetical protein